MSIVTSRLENGEIYSTTANSACSASLEPLLVMLSIARPGRTRANIFREGHYGSNFLTKEQSAMAIQYADNKRN